MFKRLFGFGKKDKKSQNDVEARGRRTISLENLDERERSMLIGFQILSANIADPEVNSTDEIVQFYHEARICGKADLAMDWMFECLRERPGEDFHSERRQVLSESIASLMGPESYVENLNLALDQGSSDPNQRMIERAKMALELVGIMQERRCVDSLAAYNPLGKVEHDLWFMTLSRVPDNRCAIALLSFLKRGRLFVAECQKAIEAMLLHHGEQLDKKLLKEFAELDGITYRVLLADGSYADPKPVDCTQIRRLAAVALRAPGAPKPN